MEVSMNNDLDELFDVSSPVREPELTYSPKNLVFIMFKGWSLAEGTIHEPTGDYHLAQVIAREGNHKNTVRIACGMFFFDLESVNYHYEFEPKRFKVCPVCSNNSPKFSKKYFDGKKLVFTRTKVNL